MPTRIRIKEHRLVRAGDLKPHPLNWRTHPPGQAEMMQELLDDVGYVEELIAYERKGKLVLLNGHMRASLDAEDQVPVTVVDLTDDEAKKVLATFDPISAIAGVEADTLSDLLSQVSFQTEALDDLMQDLQRKLPDTDISPNEFPGVTTDDITTDHKCPACGFEWSGEQK